jgi:hypothetical protein
LGEIGDEEMKDGRWRRSGDQEMIPIKTKREEAMIR